MIPGLLIVLLITAVSGAANAAKITIRSPVVVESGGTVTLGDIASITGATSAEVNRLVRIEIGAAPLPGLSRTVDLQYVKSRIRSTCGNISKLKIESPRKLTVTSRAAVVRGEDISAVAREYRPSRASAGSKRYGAGAGRPPTGAAVSDENVELTIEPPSVRLMTGSDSTEAAETGSVVIITVTRDGIRLSTCGAAERNGKRGRTVRIISPTGAAGFREVVVEPENVEVRM